MAKECTFFFINQEEKTHAAGSLAGRLDAIFALDPGAAALGFQGDWTSWGEVDALASRMADLLATAPRAAPVALVARNRPEVVGVLIALLRSRRSIWIVNPAYPPSQWWGDLGGTQPAAVVAAECDWTAVVRAGSESIARGIRLDRGGGAVAVWSREGPADTPSGGGPTIFMQTSGTTGPPSRVPLAASRLWSNLVDADVHAGRPQGEPRLRSGVVPVTAPLTHIGGVFGVLLACVNGRRVLLFEKFEPWSWAEAVKLHQIRASGLVPAAIRMVLDAGIPTADLDSLRAVRSGTAPLDPELADEFERRYGIPIITSYGATEFGGAIATLTYEDRQRWGAAKSGSVGRPHAGVDVRIVAPETGEELPAGSSGRLEVRQGGEDWVATSDLAHRDEDGFLFIDGRADGVINRGGLKVPAEKVEAALRRLDCVRAAAVVGVPDSRLGEVPAAAVVVDGTVDEDGVRQLLRAELAAYLIPARLKFVAELPTTASLKVDRARVTALLEVEDPVSVDSSVA
jgi:acyl-coenzyme A synthetase/AMP-(fatty) acid ligase